jgi:hypothetical protein
VERTRRRLLWILSIAIAVLTLLPGLALVYVYRRVETVLEAHRLDVASTLEDVPIRGSTRPAILLPAEAGNVWDLLRPALDAVADLYPLESGGRYDEYKDANLDWRGVEGETPRLLALAAPALEKCRQALRRSALDWSGPPDRDLPAKAGRIGRALCSRAAMSWEAGRDAEAVEWLIVAMVVAQDVARLGQRGTWDALQVVERWACQEARGRLADHGLGAGDLEEIGRRLDLVRASRPPLALLLRVCSADVRNGILQDSISFEQTDLKGDTDFVRLEKLAGWRDLYSVRICRARLLSGATDAYQELAGASGASNPWAGLDRIRSKYPAQDVGQLLPPSQWYDPELRARLSLDLFRLAIAVARIQAESGRFPRSLEETGVTTTLGRPVSIEEGRIDAQSGTFDLELVWSIRRRTKD